MKLFILFLAFLNSWSFAQSSGWFLLNTHTTESLFDIWFINSDTGFVSGNDGIFIGTRDGGNNWSIIPTNTSELLETIFFINNTGWVVGRNGTILKSTNSGENWSKLISPVNLDFHDIFFINENIGWISCSEGKLLKTIDGGINWTEIIIDNNIYTYVESIFFLSSSTGFASSGKFFKTTNGGIFWNFIDDYLFIDLQFLNDSTGWGVYYGHVFNSALMKTTNGGADWVSQISTPEGFNVLSFHMINENLGWSVGEPGRIWKTTNGGEDWIEQNSVTSETLFSVFFVNGKIGYSAGTQGTIIKTVSGGATNIKDEHLLIRNFYLNQNYPNPFNLVTTIKYHLPQLSLVSLKVFDILGQEVKTLVDDEQNVGFYEIQFDASSLSSGIYFYELRTPNFSSVKKMILLK